MRSPLGPSLEEVETPDRSEGLCCGSRAFYRKREPHGYARRQCAAAQGLCLDG